MDRNDTPRSIDRPVLGRWDNLGITVLIAVGSYFLLVLILSTIRVAVPLTFWGVGEVDIAYNKIAYCKSNDEIYRILRKPCLRSVNDTQWHYFDCYFRNSGLMIEFDLQDRLLKMRIYCV
jgi:hypothetical protein